MRVALLLPFSSRSASARVESQSMLNAAQLALFERGNDRLILIPKDTGGTEDGARAAADASLSEGADIILGPFFGPSVTAAAAEARRYGKAVLSFSNDSAAAAPGVYTLGFSPEQEVERIVEYATRQDITSFAALAPDSAYGWRVRAALETSAQAYGGYLERAEFFPAGGEADAMTPPARSISLFDRRRAVVGDEPGRVGEDGERLFELPYQAIMLPEGGIRLLSLAPLLPYFDVDPRVTKFLGTGLWRDPQVTTEPSLERGWFPGPDHEARTAFEESYRRYFNSDPSSLASLAYDAVVLTSDLTQLRGAAGITRTAVERDEGFLGASGKFRLRADGTTERVFGIYEVRRDGFVLIEPAPTSFTPLGF